MPFSIKKSHRYATQFVKPSNDNKVNMDDDLTSEEYSLFNINNDSSSGGGVPQKPKKGGNHIRQVSSAQSDFY